MAKKIGFKSYCWAIGTTSYRTDNFNLSIEKQLHLLRQFRELEENKNKKWGNNKKFQAEYYNFLKENNFVKGDAALPDKDAREKTSGLRDIGLLDDERNITEAGLELLRITDSADFSADNFLSTAFRSAYSNQTRIAYYAPHIPIHSSNAAGMAAMYPTDF